MLPTNLLNLLLLAIVICTLGGLFVFDILQLFFLIVEFSLNLTHIVVTSIDELGKALLSFILQIIDSLGFQLKIFLALLKLRVELVDLDQAVNISLVVVNNIFLFFLNVVDGGLNLRCQILF